MFKKHVVALALFAALGTTNAFAQNLIVSADNPSGGSNQVPVVVTASSAASITAECIEVDFYGTDVRAALLDARPIASALVTGGSLAAGQQAHLIAALPWQTLADALHLHGALYFKARVRWSMNTSYQLHAESSTALFTIFR